MIYRQCNLAIPPTISNQFISYDWYFCKAFFLTYHWNFMLYLSIYLNILLYAKIFSIYIFLFLSHPVVSYNLKQTYKYWWPINWLQNQTRTSLTYLTRFMYDRFHRTRYFPMNKFYNLFYSLKELVSEHILAI